MLSRFQFGIFQRYNMGYEVGYDQNWQRDIGYGVPATCDHPECNKEIDRGLSYVCGGDVYGGDNGCGLFFCSDHCITLCERCHDGVEPFNPKPDLDEWTNHKMTHDSWKAWRIENGLE